MLPEEEREALALLIAEAEVAPQLAGLVDHGIRESQYRQADAIIEAGWLAPVSSVSKDIVGLIADAIDCHSTMMKREDQWQCSYCDFPIKDWTEMDHHTATKVLEAIKKAGTES